MKTTQQHNNKQRKHKTAGEESGNSWVGQVNRVKLTRQEEALHGTHRTGSDLLLVLLLLL